MVALIYNEKYFSSLILTDDRHLFQRFGWTEISTGVAIFSTMQRTSMHLEEPLNDFFHDICRIAPLMMWHLFFVFSPHPEITDITRNYREGKTVIQRVPKLLLLPT